MSKQIKLQLRAAFEAGKRQQQIEGNKWYPSKAESNEVFEAWYKNFTNEQKGKKTR